MRRKSIILIAMVLILAVPFVSFAQKGTDDACRQAKIDAQRDINGTLWFGAGCLFGIFGYGAAYVIKPSPPATRLLGKSPEYVANYTDCYKEAGRKVQTKNALTGCLVSIAAEFVTYVLFFLVLSGD